VQGSQQKKDLKRRFHFHVGEGSPSSEVCGKSGPKWTFFSMNSESRGAMGLFQGAAV
jgi:hypothetical protein